jgi:hypothetical protein
VVWSDWTAAGPNLALVSSGGEGGFRVLVNGRWQRVPGSVPMKGWFRKVVLTEDGVIACLTYWSEKTALLRK